MAKTALTALVVAAISYGQGVTVPDGTKLRVRLDQTISSATAEEGQAVELSVTEAVKVNGDVVIPEAARVSGTVTQAQAKRRMGRAGKLDFSVERVRAADGEWIPLRYTLSKKTGQSNATRNGIITAGVAVVFWPAAPLVLLAKGKDVTINKGVTFDVFTDSDHLVKTRPVAPTVAQASFAATPSTAFSTPAALTTPSAPARAGGASVSVTSAVQGAEIEVDGAYVGNTPTTIRLAAGPHQILVRHGSRVWQRTMQVTPGSNVTVNAAVTGSSVRTISN
jgi:hypothetical protein